MCNTLKEIYDGYLAESNMVVYYNTRLEHDKFEDLDFSDIEKYFCDGEKKPCIPDKARPFFESTGKGKQRIKHVFSAYLLGIYCYDNIGIIREDFNAFIEKKIWPQIQ